MRLLRGTVHQEFGLAQLELLRKGPESSKAARKVEPCLRKGIGDGVTPDIVHRLAWRFWGACKYLDKSPSLAASKSSPGGMASKAHGSSRRGMTPKPPPRRPDQIVRLQDLAKGVTRPLSSCFELDI